jgi:hypothetical protein
MTKRDWPIIPASEPDEAAELRAENARLRAQLTKATDLNTTLCDWSCKLEARCALLNARVWRLIRLARQPHPGGRPRKAKVGKRREREIKAASRAAAAAKTEAEAMAARFAESVKVRRIKFPLEFEARRLKKSGDN